VISDSLADVRSRLYEARATQHADCGGDKVATLIFIGVASAPCCRIALAAEADMLRGRIVTQNLTFAVRKGRGARESYREKPGMKGRVISLSPSRGLGGGIEPYLGQFSSWDVGANVEAISLTVALAPGIDTPGGRWGYCPNHPVAETSP
jgi:hypothetical protein